MRSSQDLHHGFDRGAPWGKTGKRLVVSNVQSSIVVEHVTKTYVPSPTWLRALVKSNISEPVTALRDISFTVDPGEIVGVVGPNGAGKTTTFRILVGLTTPTSGTARVMGYDAAKNAADVRSLVGWMPGDDRSLLMRLTCAENLRFHGRLQGLDPRTMDDAITEVLETVGLAHAHSKTIFALSAGMRSRLQLARALLHHPRVLILDEPTAAIDPVASHALLNLIMEIVKERELAALVSSHRLEEIEALGSRVILLDRGTIRHDGDLDWMRNKLERPMLEIEFDDAASATLALKTINESGLHTISSLKDDITVRCELDHGAPTGAVLDEFNGLLPQISRISEVKRPLRELLAELYGEDDTSVHRDRRARDAGDGDGRTGRKRKKDKQKTGSRRIRR
ncbi:MAG TPA: ABC transporter ATP-binding protein [Acidimicrobiia bacterium]|jgi:ABC-2 type transport system ATP-binding protein|nr:ABC transporter ATP-binding protein [Acidimicrobiia bacterium]